MSYLPRQSREKYLKQYDMFNTWRLAKGAKIKDYSVIPTMMTSQFTFIAIWVLIFIST